MGEVIAFPSEENRIAQMAEELASEGQIHAQGLRDVAAWRRQARAAARSIGRPVQTLAEGDEAWAILRDWPRDAGEEEKQANRLQRAIESLPSPPPRLTLGRRAAAR